MTENGTRVRAHIDDVAKAAGVSPTTVSHVYSGKRPVSARTRAIVFDAAQRLNYRPTVAARGLATGRTMAIGLQFPMEGEGLLLNPYFPDVLAGLSAAATHAGYSFILLPTSSSTGFPLDTVLEAQRLDAAICVDPKGSDDVIPLLRRYGVPVITLGRYLGRVATHWVDNDHQEAMAELFNHLFDEGYRRPALISMRPAEYSYLRDMEAAFRGQTAARSVPGRIARAADLSERSGYDEAIALLTARPAPDVLVCVVDRLALGALAAAADLGRRVPEDVAITGEGNTLLARNATPSITSIDAHADALGQAAIDLVHRIVEGRGPRHDRRRPQDLERVIVPVTVMVRDSTSRLHRMRT